MTKLGVPSKQGLYNPAFEHDACGIGFIANVKGKTSHEIVKNGIKMLCKMEHRGGQGSDGKTGDGAGIMLQIPDLFFRKVCLKEGIVLPEGGKYAVGMFFLPMDSNKRTAIEKKVAEIIREEGQTFLGWRSVPTNPLTIGETARASQPFIRQLFIEAGVGIADALSFERKLFVIRKQVEQWISGITNGQNDFYIASLSSQTIVYKGMLTPDQIDTFYLDLQDPAFTSAFSLVHSRFSTNTFPSWKRAHPNRYLMHNGEINTLRGNVNWMLAREKRFATDAFGDDLQKVLPIMDLEGSDSSILDNCFEFLVLSGRSLPHAAMMMIPEPWDNHYFTSDAKKAFYEFHSCLMEPWDGPTAIAFTNGKQIGAILDRNGLRPGRYYLTSNDMIVFASEVGVVDLPEETIISKQRLSPGRMLLVDLEEGRIISDEEIKEQMSTALPYRQWLTNNLVELNSLIDDVQEEEVIPKEDLVQKQITYGYTYEELTKNIAPMVTEGKDPIGSMGNDTPLAVLSNKPQLLYNYFKQSFAQVTNPPIDAIREDCVTSTISYLGAEQNLLNPVPESCRRIRLKTPVVNNRELAKLKNNSHESFPALTIPIVFDATAGEAGLEHALGKVFSQVDQAILNGYTLIILSDRGMNKDLAAIPSLLAVSGLHHHLIRKGTRTQVSLILETGEARDVHQFAMLLGYGTDAINPYLAIATIRDMVQDEVLTNITAEEAVEKYIKATTDGVVKVMSKMGISTIQSYRGAQIFEAIGIAESVIERYFTRTASQIGGINLEMIAKETLIRHAKAFHELDYKPLGLDSGSDFQWRRDGEVHAFNPQTIHTLQQACREGDYALFKTFTALANEERVAFLRDLVSVKKERQPIPIEEVESIEAICRRFKTGAMSYGAISQEAHEALAIAMNRIGGKSNSGEGGEDSSRYAPDANGELRRSAIKQVASGRFGVSSHYLVNADEIQIKMAQGAKPGEGGQLPGNKVYPWIAEVRGSTPGVGLISPPPHHDIYSIEDLAQLIHDLKNANPNARISVKLVSKPGVGTIAAGVAKGLADVILISGYEGGTGASPKTSIKHAGFPWELGLAETHQTLLLNNLRDRVVLEADGKMMTGRDVIIAALLGAEEFSFSTAPLVVLGCIMMRVCHMDTCPVGVATQNPELRKNFMGDPEYVVNYMQFIAQEVREIMADLGFRSLEEMVGRTELLTVGDKVKSHWKAKDLDFTHLFYQPNVSAEVGRTNKKSQDHRLARSLDLQKLIEICQPAIDHKQPVEETLFIENSNRVVGTLVGSEITRRYGLEGLPEDTIRLHFKGSAGQSFGAFIPKGMTLTLEGDANDYVGKGLSGGKIVVAPSKKAKFLPEENVIIGNVAFYGATSGEAYIRGIAGERFCVRNSGVNAVVEGVGDHGCEYMTGGRVVILGQVGKNFAAGMSGGIVYVFSHNHESFKQLCNSEMVLLESISEDREVEELKQMIKNHFNYTKSRVAQKVLFHWEEMLPKFIKVIPKDYKRMLTTIHQMMELGLDQKDATMAAFEQHKQNAVKTDSKAKILHTVNR